jgi:hypothetical protein
VLAEQEANLSMSNTNGHVKSTSIHDRLLHALELAGGQLGLQELIFNYRFSRSQIDDLLESAHSPIRIRLHYNGGKQPSTMVVLKSYTAPKPVTQQEAQAKLNSMSSEEYYALVDPTYRLRHKRPAGGGCRTSTSASERT